MLAPLYDLLSTAVYSSLSAKMAMKIGGVYRFSEVQPRHWDRFAQEVGLSVAPARRRIQDFARALPIAAHQLQTDPHQGFGGHAIVECIELLV